MRRRWDARGSGTGETRRGNSTHPILAVDVTACVKHGLHTALRHGRSVEKLSDAGGRREHSSAGCREPRTHRCRSPSRAASWMGAIAAFQAADAGARCPMRASLRRRALASGWLPRALRSHGAQVAPSAEQRRSHGTVRCLRSTAQAPAGAQHAQSGSRPRASLLVQGDPRPGPGARTAWVDDGPTRPQTRLGLVRATRTGTVRRELDRPTRGGGRDARGANRA